MHLVTIRVSDSLNHAKIQTSSIHIFVSFDHHQTPRYAIRTMRIRVTESFRSRDCDQARLRHQPEPLQHPTPELSLACHARIPVRISGVQYVFRNDTMGSIYELFRIVAQDDV